MIGASARYAAELAWPTPAGAFPWTTFTVNVTGCALIGILMVNVVESRRIHRLLRPFLGVGVLGGFTTFSTYAVQTETLVADGHSATAVTYLLGTLAAALAAVAGGVLLARVGRRLRDVAAMPRRSR